MKFGDLVRRKPECFDERVQYAGGFDAVGVVTSRNALHVGAPLRCFVKVFVEGQGYKTLTVHREKWEVISANR